MSVINAAIRHKFHTSSKAPHWPAESKDETCYHHGLLGTEPCADCKTVFCEVCDLTAFGCTDCERLVCCGHTCENCATWYCKAHYHKDTSRCDDCHKEFKKELKIVMAETRARELIDAALESTSDEEEEKTSSEMEEGEDEDEQEEEEKTKSVKLCSNSAVSRHAWLLSTHHWRTKFGESQEVWRLYISKSNVCIYSCICILAVRGLPATDGLYSVTREEEDTFAGSYRK